MKKNAYKISAIMPVISFKLFFVLNVNSVVKMYFSVSSVSDTFSYKFQGRFSHLLMKC